MADSFDEGKSRGILWTFGILLMITLLILVFLGAWWGAEPEQFSIQDEALERAKITKTTDIPLGYTYTNTLAHIAELLLHKPGGYITNDVAPPGVFLDNISSFEYGALIMLRDATTALRNHFTRDQSQSDEDPDLKVAEPYFYYENDSWALPSTEAEYQKGIDALHKYMARLQKIWRQCQARAILFTGRQSLAIHRGRHQASGQLVHPVERQYGRRGVCPRPGRRRTQCHDQECKGGAA